MEVPSEDELDGAILEEDEEEAVEGVEEAEETHELTQEKDDDNQHPMDNGNDEFSS